VQCVGSYYASPCSFPFQLFQHGRNSLVLSCVWITQRNQTSDCNNIWFFYSRRPSGLGKPHLPVNWRQQPVSLFIKWLPCKKEVSQSEIRITKNSSVGFFEANHCICFCHTDNNLDTTLQCVMSKSTKFDFNFFINYRR